MHVAGIDTHATYVVVAIVSNSPQRAIGLHLLQHNSVQPTRLLQVVAGVSDILRYGLACEFCDDILVRSEEVRSTVIGLAEPA